MLLRLMKKYASEKMSEKASVNNRAIQIFVKKPLIGLFMLLCAAFLPGCAPKDPSIYDMRSPCVASEPIDSQNTHALEPCIKRTPEMNSLFI